MNMNEFQLEGYRDFFNKKWEHDCPYPEGTKEANEWLAGYNEARRGPSRD